MADEFCLKMPDFRVTFRDLLHAVNLRHGADGFTSLSKEGVLRNFFALKSPTASAGFEPANLGTRGQHATSRPPKPLNFNVNKIMHIKCDFKSKKHENFPPSTPNATYFTFSAVATIPLSEKS